MVLIESRLCWTEGLPGVGGPRSKWRTLSPGKAVIVIAGGLGAPLQGAGFPRAGDLEGREGGGKERETERESEC